MGNLVYCFDLDGTLLKSEIDEKGNYYNCRPINNRISKVNKLFDEGNTIIIYTGRHWNHLQATARQLRKWKVRYHSLALGKPVADYYIDDHAINDKDFFREVK